MEQTTQAGLVRETDGELLSRFASTGDQQAFSELIRRHGGMVLRICRRLNGGDPHAADDAAQQVFLTLASRAGVLKTRVSLAGWLYRSAWHVATRQQRELDTRARHERHATPHAVGGEPCAADDVPYAVITTELSAALHRALANLPEGYRDALVLHHLAGHTVQETARRLAVPIGTAASWVSRGRAALRQQLEGMGYMVPVGVIGAWLGAEAAAASEARRQGAWAATGANGTLSPGSVGGGAGGSLGIAVPVPTGGGGTAVAASAVSAPAASIFGLSRAAVLAAAIVTGGTTAAAGHAVATNFDAVKKAIGREAAAEPESPAPSKPRHAHSIDTPRINLDFSNGSASVPEPSSAAVLLLTGCLALRRRRRG